MGRVNGKAGEAGFQHVHSGSFDLACETDQYIPAETCFMFFIVFSRFFKPAKCLYSPAHTIYSISLSSGGDPADSVDIQHEIDFAYSPPIKNLFI